MPLLSASITVGVDTEGGEVLFVSTGITDDIDIREGGTWKDMPMGGRAQAFFSRVVAISSTEATSALSVCPVKRLIFHTRACFLASYLALPASQHQADVTLVSVWYETCVA